jgi:hypothetical protein
MELTIETKYTILKENLINIGNDHVFEHLMLLRPYYHQVII